MYTLKVTLKNTFNISLQNLTPKNVKKKFLKFLKKSMTVQLNILLKQLSLLRGLLAKILSLDLPGSSFR